MKALVTGGGGFLGRHIVERLLTRGCGVVALQRSAQPALAERGAQVIQADITDAEAVAKAAEGCDAVFHTAAKAGYWGSRASYHAPNVEGTRNVLAACLKHGVTRLVHTSTPSVVFNGESFQGADESLPYGRDWLCHYAETKAIAEEEALKANGQEGLRTVALRPHLIWGKGDPHIIPRIVERASMRKLKIIGDGSNRVDITHVDNAADAHLNAFDALAEGKGAGKAYFISQGEPVVLWDWINDLLRRLDLPAATRKVPFNKAYRAGALIEKTWKLLRLPSEPPMTRFLAIELGKDHFFDISAAKRDLGYAPGVSTEEGLTELVAALHEARPER